MRGEVGRRGGQVGVLVGRDDGEPSAGAARVGSEAPGRRVGVAQTVYGLLASDVRSTTSEGAWSAPERSRSRTSAGSPPPRQDRGDGLHVVGAAGVGRGRPRRGDGVRRRAQGQLGAADPCGEGGGSAVAGSAPASSTAVAAATTRPACAGWTTRGSRPVSAGATTSAAGRSRRGRWRWPAMRGPRGDGWDGGSRAPRASGRDRRGARGRERPSSARTPARHDEGDPGGVTGGAALGVPAEPDGPRRGGHRRSP